jgi:hypothetical protein
MNCPQHIPRLVRADDAERAIESLRRRIGYLEETLRRADIAFTPEVP